MAAAAVAASEAAGEWSYWRALRSARLGALLAGNLISSIGNGMIISALPLLTLQIRGGFPAGLAIAMVQGSPYVLATVLALTLGLGRMRILPRALLIADSLLRSAAFILLGTLAVAGQLTLWMLVGGLLAGSVFQIASYSSRRLLATEMTGPAGQFAVNGLLGTSSSVALYTVGPVVGGITATVASPGVALIIDGLTFVVMLGAVYFAVPAKRQPDAGRAAPASGLRILRAVPPAARLFVVVFCFNLFYMPVDVALPLLVRGHLEGSGTALGLIWSGFGAGALLGGMATILLRRARPSPC
jgi:MFS family permease